MKRKFDFLPKAELVFKIFYLLTILFAFNSMFAGHKIFTIFNIILAMYGAVLLFFRAMHFKDYVHGADGVLMILFCVSGFISALANMKYGLIDNIQGLIWTTFQFGLLYMTDRNRSKEEYKKEFILLASIFVLYVFIANLTGLIMFICNYGVRGAESPSGNIIGYIWGRLWGVYIDPNIGSAFSAACVVFCCCAIAAYKNVALRIFAVLHMILDYLFVMLSDSRSGIVCIFVGTASVLIFLFFAKANSKKRKTAPIWKKALTIVLIICLSGMLFVAFQGVKKAYNAYLELKIEQQAEGNSEAGEEADKHSPPMITGRDETEATLSDVSNGRFGLWKSALQLWKTAPLFGLSERNVVAYAKDVLPDTYLVNNPNGEYDSFHNLFVDVLAKQGLVGFLLLISIFVYVAIRLVRYFFRNKEARSSIYLIAMFCALVVFSVECMFVLDVLYLNSATSFLFWGMLGYLMHALPLEASGNKNDVDKKESLNG